VRRFLALLLLLAGCLTDARGEQHVDLFRVHQGLELMEARFTDAAAIHFDTDRDLYLSLRQWAETVRAIDIEVEAALAEGNRVPDFAFFLTEMRAAVTGLLVYTHEDPSKQSSVRSYGLLLGTALDLVALALERPPPIKP
jgi:hypothetical protein